LGDRQQYDMPRTGFYDQVFKTTNLTLSGNLLGVKVMSITGYTYNEYSTSYDLSWALDPPPSATGTGTPLYVSNQSHKFSQEVRLSGTMGSHLEWLLGGFYTQENTRSIETITTTKVATGAVFDLASGTIGGNIPGDYLYQYAPDRFREEAGFGALTLKMTDSFDIQVGARESYMETPSLFGWGGGLFNGDPPGASVYSPPSSEYWKGNAFTYMVSPRYRLTSDLMVYARVADGFRPGSGTNNPQPTDSCVQQHTPCIVHPDKTTDYEIGTKADFFNRTLSVDASIYYIKWTDLQVNLVGANDLNYNGNGAGAKSQGVDLSLSWKPLEGLTVSTWGAWNQAVVTQAFANASAGQPLPFSSRFSGNFSVEQGIHITSSLDAFVSATEIYVGNRPGPFTAIAAPREDMPAYSQTNLNVGIKAKPWTFGLYANNVTDRRAILFGGPGTGDAPYEFNYIKPRMIGLSVEMAF
jgi:outer membrane receptor protein involved in Fe transport